MILLTDEYEEVFKKGKCILKISGEYTRVKAWVDDIARITRSNLGCYAVEKISGRVHVLFAGSELQREQVERVIDAKISECPGTIVERIL